MVHSRIRGRTALQIAHSLEEAICSGAYGAGSLVPPVREAAQSLNVNAATVAAAYRLLRARGLLSGDRRRGTRVTPPRDPHSLAALTRERIPDGVVDLASGNPDVRLLPALSSAFRKVSEEPTLYGQQADLRPLVTFAKTEFANDDIQADDVLVASGALDAIDRVLREHLRPGDRVGVEDPCFPALLDLLNASGFKAEPIAVDGEGPLPDSMDSVLTRRPAAVVLTPRAQNPTGAAISPSRAAALRTVLEQHEPPMVIENDPCGPVAGVPTVTLTQGRARWVIVRSMSKFLGPDLRVAVVAGDPMTLARVRGRQAVSVRWVSHVLQQLALSLWSDPSSGRQLARAGDVYARRREALATALASHDIAASAVSGFNMWIPVRHESDVVQYLMARGWAVASGDRFRIRCGPGIRVTTSALEPDDAQRFARDLRAALRSSSPMTA